MNTPLITETIVDNPEMHGRLVESHPLRRIAEPEEVADAIVWLCSEKSSYVTGIVLPVNAATPPTSDR